MKNRLLVGFVSVFLLVSAAGTVAAERRVALVIGNNDYQNVPKLEKAVNDAMAVSRALGKIGFEVMYLPNAGQKKMNQAVNEFAQKIAGGGIGVFFFAGHGLQINNQNFLLPVDIDMPKDPNDIDDQAISLVRVQDKLADAKAKFSLLVIDACRNNPLPKKAGRSLSGMPGLAQPSSPTGQIVLFSAGTNQQALDKLSDTDSNPNGLFTREFLPMISTPGLSAADALKKVRTSVTSKARAVGHDQNPALYDQTDGDFYFIAGAPQQLASVAPATGPAVSQSAIELELWSSIKSSNDPEDFKEYLARYPNGQFASIAQRRVAAVSQPTTRRSAEAPSPPPAAAAAPTSEGPSIASRVEELGRMTYLKVSDLRATKRDNLLRVQAEITNTSHQNQQLYYRFKWLDRDGFSVWDDEPWKPLVVYGNQKQQINVVAPTFKAVDFRVELQSPNNEASSGRAN